MNAYVLIERFVATQEKPNYTQIAFAFQEAGLAEAGKINQAESIGQVRRQMEVSYKLPSFDEWCHKEVANLE